MAAQSDEIVRGEDGVRRCFWCAGDPLYRAYHDAEWGFPQRDDTRLFEKLCLEGFQAGLSWITVLRKRENFRRAFAGFDMEQVARFTPRKVESLLQDGGIIRHRGKIESAIHNARKALELAEERGSLSNYLWSFEPPVTERPARITLDVLRKLTESPSSRALSKDLKRRGWTFVGPITMYALLQAMGMVNDHLARCDLRSKAECARRR